MLWSAGAGGGWNAGNCVGEGKCGGMCVLGGRSGQKERGWGGMVSGSGRRMECGKLRGEGECGGMCVLGGESGRRGEVKGTVVAVQCRAAGEVKAMAGAEGGKRVWLPQIQK